MTIAENISSCLGESKKGSKGVGDDYSYDLTHII